MAIDPDVQAVIDLQNTLIADLTLRIEALEAGGGSPTGNYDVNGTFIGAITPVPDPVP